MKWFRSAVRDHGPGARDAGEVQCARGLVRGCTRTPVPLATSTPRPLSCWASGSWRTGAAPLRGRHDRRHRGAGVEHDRWSPPCRSCSRPLPRSRPATGRRWNTRPCCGTTRTTALSNPMMAPGCDLAHNPLACGIAVRGFMLSVNSPHGRRAATRGEDHG